ncbi:MAG TPA: nuclear transport factor 2 family protein [Terriglobales bacterium]|nr:nuclear transport factor 2 family protein [Terriglobales bacterium]
MRYLVANACLLATCLSAVCATLMIPSSIPKNGAEVIVQNLSEEEAEAFLRRDSDALSRMWSDDLIVTNPLNNLVTKQQVLQMVRSGFLVITSYSRKVEYAKKYGDVVILVGAEEVVWGGRMPNAGKFEKLRFTAVWRNENGTWREVVRHANIIHAEPQPHPGS